jgi:hypothetical protein
MNGIGQRLERGDDDRIAGVDTKRVDVLHRANRDAGVGGIAHDFVFDLLPASEVALDHDLPDGAETQSNAHALLEGLLRVDDATARPSERKGGPHDGG